MDEVRMVHLRTVPTSFHARVLAARLGADGITTQLRGAVDGPYPVGDVMLWVAEDDLSVARELLLADEVEAVFDEDGTGEPRREPALGWLSPALALAVLVLVAGSLLVHAV